MLRTMNPFDICFFFFLFKQHQNFSSNFFHLKFLKILTWDTNDHVVHSYIDPHNYY